MPDSKKVLIIGAGFAGLNCAKRLATEKKLAVTLVDRNNHHLFQPLLYQVAMAGLSPAEIAAPIRSVLSNLQIQVLMGEVQSIDLSRQLATADFGELNYDYLVLACGAQHSYFGHDEWENFAPGLKTVQQATEIRRRVLTAFEEAERELDRNRQKELLTFIVVGGGPTGVELAGALGEISRFTLTNDFLNIDPRLARVILIEAGERILPSFSAKLSRRAMRDLEKLGVQVWTQSRVTKITESGVEMGSEVILGRTVLWAAGVEPSPLNRFLGVPLLKDGRVPILPDLSLEGHPKVFVLGDQAASYSKQGKLHPGLAPVATQQGNHAAKNILADLQNKPRSPFRYTDKGQMATIGRKQAIVQIGAFTFAGYFAWLMWLVVHIFYLIGFRNRILVLVNWAWSYFRYSRGARLIVGKEWRTHHAK